ncbi:MAG: type II toxin-antitoxin system RelE family toxin [Candidatus Dormibacteraceae bacterium]
MSTTPQTDKDLGRLSKPDRERIKRSIQKLPEGDIRQLQGWRPPVWRLRVGNWRVLYRLNISEAIITVIAVRPRGSAYKP